MGGHCNFDSLMSVKLEPFILGLKTLGQQTSNNDWLSLA